MIEIYVYGLVNSVLVILLLGNKRVFEVMARFSLDALPGRLLVLDNDKQLDDEMKEEKRKLLQDNIDKMEGWKRISRIIFNYIFVETILAFVLLILSKIFLNERETAILIVICISTVLHISACVFLSVKYMKNRSVIYSPTSE